MYVCMYLYLYLYLYIYIYIYIDSSARRPDHTSYNDKTTSGAPAPTAQQRSLRRRQQQSAERGWTLQPCESGGWRRAKGPPGRLTRLELSVRVSNGDS